ncbi:MAG: dihydrolipoyl dehydrogenase [Chloroflexi bacterium]|nr:dihydrolipoyl dehydrogenase [Chloroflexota bacterium]
MTIRCDIAIVGAGPGGYVAALRAAQLGAKVVLVEKDKLGGVCLNWGCIPTKTLLRTAEVLRLTREAAEYGVMVDGVRLDWAAAQKRKEGVVRRLTGGVKFLLERAGVQLLFGTARFVSPTALEVVGANGQERVEARDYVIATGSRPASLPIPGLEGPGVLTSDEALALEALPESLLVIGAGPIGVEFATLFRACGVQVTLVELLPRVLPTLDEDLGGEVERALKKAKVAVYTGSQVSKVERSNGKYTVTIQQADQQSAVEVDKILVAVGRRPNVEGLGLDVLGVQVEKSGIKVDEFMRTNVPHIYAVGDVTGGILLAHVAMHEGVVAVENAMGLQRAMNYAAVPSCVFSSPEVASVGLSEEQARQQGYDLHIGKFPFRGNGKALAQGEYEGLVKIVAESKYGQILGVHIVGPHASDLIQEGTLALTLEATLDEIEVTIHPHPTLSEAVAEAALAAKGRALHS